MSRSSGKSMWTRCGEKMECSRVPIQSLPYSAGLISQSCWFLEFKKIVLLIGAGNTEAEIKIECLDNNLLGAPKEYRARRMYGYLINRSKMLDEDLLQLFVEGDLRTQKLINLIAILRGDRLFFEFVYEVYREKAILGQRELEDSDVSVFFRNKENQSDVIEKWNEGTKKHLKSNYITCMADAGLIRVEKKTRYITPPIVDHPLESYLERCGDHAILIAMTGVA